MDLFRFEVQKLFLNKRTLAIILACLLISFITGAITMVGLKNNSGDFSKLTALIREHEGAVNPLLAAEADGDVSRLQALRTTDPEAFAGEAPWYVTFQYMYANAGNMVQNFREGSERENPERPYSINRLKAYLERHSNERGSYDYINAGLNLRMKLEAGEPGFYNVLVWDEIFGFFNGGGTAFLVLLLAIVAAPVFSGETASGMDSVILSSKLGRRKVVTAKLAAAGVFATVWTACFFILNPAVYFVFSGGLEGFDKPLNSIFMFHLSPYGGLTILSYLLISAGLAWLACLTCSAAAALISATQRASLPAFGIILALVLLPQLLDTPGMRSVLWPIIDFGLMRIAQGGPVFSGYKAYNVLGNPVLYPAAAVIILAVLCIVTVRLTYFAYRRKNAI